MGNQINKFNITNVPSLYDESITKKQVIQENYFSVCVELVLMVAVIISITIHCQPFEKTIITRIVDSDFLLITGGNQRTFVGGIITFLYSTTMTFIIIGLLQEQFTLNAWIDSTQMASQNSELLVSNTLFAEVKLHATQIGLKYSEQDRQKLNLCDPEIFHLNANIDRRVGIDS